MLLSYGSHPDQVADIVLPPRPEGPAPLVLLLHGGFWRAKHDRQHVRVVADDLAARGYVVANTEYRRVGAGGGWPGTFLDVALAMDTLPGLIERELPGRVDHDHIVYCGHSAGGQLALWGAVRHRLPDAAPGLRTSPPRVAGVVALAPVCDLAEAYRLGNGEGAVAELFGGGPDDLPDRYAATDPAVLGAPEVPAVIVHGDQDQRVPVAMARRYHATFGVKLIELPGAGHFELIDPGSAAWPSVLDAVRLVVS